MEIYSHTPEVILSDPILERAGITVVVKREDLNHPLISGNKWWKLKHNLKEAKKLGQRKLLTFGGAYSNHIYATAAAAKEAGFKSIGVIRGEKVLPLNPTLQFAQDAGMDLHFVSRQNYRLKTTTSFIQGLKNSFGDFYLIPEGGTNSLAVKGCEEFAINELSKINCDYILLPVGTGGTIAGLICGFKGKKKIIGVSILKDGNFLRDEINLLIQNFSGSEFGNWDLLTSYHQGGYAKVTEELKRFIVMMQVQHNLPLDAVYTGKLLWAVMKEAEKGTFAEGSTVLVLHTGGLQGASTLR
jgi:1-aminocyclopropane-1-carboxylate deaminase/D-cysteine desulfhydrase-like pyridoxal-dependent ACC family enzyme